MYAYIKGNIIEKNDNNIIIENNNIGYQIFMPYSNIVDLEIGEESKIYTYFLTPLFLLVSEYSSMYLEKYLQIDDLQS